MVELVDFSEVSELKATCHRLFVQDRSQSLGDWVTNEQLQVDLFMYRLYRLIRCHGSGSNPGALIRRFPNRAPAYDFRLSQSATTPCKKLKVHKDNVCFHAWMATKV